MRDRSHSLFPALLLTLLAGVSVWLDRVTQQEPVARTDKTRHEADFSADKITLHRFDQTGKIQYVLVADSMVHYADDESSELKNPRLNYLNRPEPVWVESNFARVNKDGDAVVLTDNVFVRRDATAGKPESTLRTEEMTVWPARILPISASLGGRTLTTTSAAPISAWALGSMVTPAAS